MNRILFATLLVPTLISGGQISAEEPASAQSQTPIMEAGVARERIAQVVGDAVDPLEREKVLSEVIERSDDPQIIAIARYNLGTAFVERSEDDPTRLEEAIVSFRAADRASSDPDLQMMARFNLAHAYYLLAHSPKNTQADESGPNNMESMIESLKEKVGDLRIAAGAFRSVIDVDIHNERASANVERIRNEINKLQEQIKALEEMQRQQQEQQSQQQQQQQDAADKLKELAQEQQEQADKTDSSPPENEQQSQQQQRDQQELNEQTGEAQQELAEQNDADKIQEKIDEAREAQDRAQEAMKQGDQQKAGEEQQKAAQALQEAAQTMQEMADKSKEQGDGQEGSEGEDQGERGEDGKQSGQPDEESGKDKGDEISEIAKQLLDKERREREVRRVYRSTGRPTKVEKDW